MFYCLFCFLFAILVFPDEFSRVLARKKLRCFCFLTALSCPSLDYENELLYQASSKPAKKKNCSTKPLLDQKRSRSVLPSLLSAVSRKLYKASQTSDMKKNCFTRPPLSKRMKNCSTRLSYGCFQKLPRGSKRLSESPRGSERFPENF